MTKRKYKFTGETMRHFDRTLHRIQALRSFGDVKAGDLGGWLESEANLSHSGMCWIYDEAKAYDQSRVCNDARIYNEAEISGRARVSGKVRISDSVSVHSRARVRGEAVIRGTVHISDDTEIAGKAYIYDMT